LKNKNIKTNPPIAIVGVGCRFPGGADSLENYWQLLLNGKDAIIDIPPDRWDFRKYYDKNNNVAGKHYCKQGGFLEESIFEFDPLFFGISPREAEVMDPQQRLLLEVCYESFENAGIPLEKLKGSKTGVFIGGFCLDNLSIQLGETNRHKINSLTPMSGSMTMLANRISYTFDLKGPSFSIDTACSSSHVALHYACMSIWNGESEMAIAGGANAMVYPSYTIVLSKGQFMSDHSRCKAFDADGSGYVRGEGAGVVLLKPLDKAIEDGDTIHALIRATGVNHDGQTSGFTVPNENAQEDLIRNVYKLGNISPEQIKYIEAHGTGTKVGDPKEVEVLNRIFGSVYKDGKKCPVGSVKTNIGHLEAAAGIAGVIKAALVLKNKQIPPNLHFNNPNPDINYENGCIKIPTKPIPLDTDDNEEAYASINSFGYGGTNGHIVLSGYKNPPKKNTAIERELYILPISATSESALKDLAASYLSFLNYNKELSIADLAYSLAFRQSHHSFRLVFIVNSKEDFYKKLEQYVSSGFIGAGVVYNADASRKKPAIAFVYTGMGPQWWAMGRELYNKEEVFKLAVDKCDTVFTKISGWSIKDILLANESVSKIKETRFAQPANFVLQVALTELWNHWGIAPNVLVGHSVGEVASAYISGSLSLEDALLLSFHRARLQQQTAGKGTMLAAGVAADRVHQYIKENEKVSVAANNSPESVSLSGKKKDLEAIAKRLEDAGHFNRLLDVEIPYHSFVMEDIKEDLLAKLSPLQPKSSDTPLYSTVTGTKIDGKELNAKYWWKNARQPVLFAKGVKSLLDDEISLFLEVGPHPVLKTSIRQCAMQADREIFQCFSIRKDKPELELMLENLATLFTLGHDINWSRITPTGNFISLPRYPWQKSYYWHESIESKERRVGLKNSHSFFYENLRLPNPTFTVELSEQFIPYLNQHLVSGQIVLPGAAYVEAGLALHEQLFGKKIATLQQLEFKQFLIRNPNSVQHLYFQYTPQTHQYKVFSKLEEEDSEWVLHAKGQLLEESIRNIIVQKNINELINKCPNIEDPEEIYRKIAWAGLEYGPHFRLIKKMRTGDDCIFTEIEIPSDLISPEEHYLMHPAILDNVFQALFIKVDSTGRNDPLVPISIRQVEFFQSPVQSKCFCYIEVTDIQANSIEGNCWVLDDNGNVLMKISGLRCRKVIEKNISEKVNNLYQWTWEKTPFKEKVDKQINQVVIISNTPDTLVLETSIQLTRLEQKNALTSLKALTIDSSEPLYVIYDSNHIENLGYQKILDEQVWFVQFTQLLGELSTKRPVKLMVLTHQAQKVNKDDMVSNLIGGTLWGSTAVVSNEYPNIDYVLIDLDVSVEVDSILEEELFHFQSGEELAYRDGERLRKVLEYLNIEETKTTTNDKNSEVNTKDEAVSLVVSNPGELDSLGYKLEERIAPKGSEIEFKVAYSSINFKDLLKVMGQLASSVTEGTYIGDAIGMECSGIVTAIGPDCTDFEVGNEIMACLPGTFKSYITVDSKYVLKKPSNISLAESSSIIIAFMTTYYGLIETARLDSDDTILIHNATGGVGLSAIEIAKWKGARIIATAGTLKKRQYLESLGIERIANSRDLEFANKVREWTNGKGVDVVINAIAGESLLQSFDLLAPFGRFIEIGKKDISENNFLPLYKFNKNISFTAIDIDLLLGHKEKRTLRLMNEIKEILESKKIKPVPVTIYEATNIRDAFGLIAQNKHIGRVVVNMQDQQLEVASKNSALISEKGCYLISGGTGGLGIELTKWLGEQGAEKIILLSRSGKTSDQGQSTFEKVLKNGTEIEIIQADVTNLESLKAIVLKIQESPYILKGVFHAAMVLDDCFWNDLDINRLNKVLAPKISGVLNLHEIVKDLSLDFFVNFSSISSLIGNAGQGSYVIANAFLDSFAYYRQSLGLPSITINLGPLAETGILTKNQDVAQLLESTGIKGLSNRTVLEGIEKLIATDVAQAGLFEIDWQQFRAIQSKTVTKFDKLTGSDGSIMQNPQLNQLYKDIASLSRSARLEYIEKALLESLAPVLRIPVENISKDTGINYLGIDSLLTVELIRHIEQRTGLEVSNMDILSGPSINQLATLMLSRIEIPAEYLIVQIDDMDEAELDKLLSTLK